MSKGMVAGIVASFTIIVTFIVYLMIFGALLNSPLASTPQAKAVLETGQQATIEVFNWWSLADDIEGLVILLGVIFGIIWMVIKIVEKESGNYGGL